MTTDIDLLKKREELEPFLLDLHRTVEVDAFWRTLRNLLDAAFPNLSVIAALRVSGKIPPAIFHSQRRSHHTHAWTTRMLAAHPCHAHLQANPGIPVLRLSELLTHEILEGHPFNHEFLKPQGWFHGMAFAFRTGNRIHTLVPVNRSRDQPDFSDEELQLARWLHPQIDAALRRIMDLLPLTEAHRSLVGYLADLPMPTLWLCWNLKPVFASHAARKLLNDWRNFDDPLPGKPSTSRVRIPREIREACISLKQNILKTGSTRWPPPALPPPVHITHPASQNITAIIRPTLTSRSALSHPGFWIHLKKGAPPPDTPQNPTVINPLSPAELAVADLLLHGLSNGEIAARLNRSLSTVKAQLQSAYRKLGVHNRIGMIAKLHSTP